MTAPKIFPLAPGAVSVDFGNEISVELNERALALAGWFDKNRFPGLVEAAPAYSSVAIFFNLAKVRTAFPEFETGFEAVKNLVLSAMPDRPAEASKHSHIVDIPVDFGGGVALDIDAVAKHGGVSVPELIRIFTSTTYRVFMLGFLPGFAYMGEVDERIAVPRKKAPRTSVPKGSVGIAGRQTGTYPLDSPGGWQIIGRTHLEMFTPHANPPALLQPGDTIKFSVLSS